MPPSALPSRRQSIVVDEGQHGTLAARFGPAPPSTTSSTSRTAPYPFHHQPPSLPAPPSRQSSSFFEVVSFEGERKRHVLWTRGADGAMWWRDHRRGQDGMTPLGPQTFAIQDAGGSYSFSDHCIYLTKAKLAPGQVNYPDLSAEHKTIFDQARKKEIDSLLANKAITILSIKESEEFRKNFPDHVLKSRYVDRWKPSGDGKFSVLPEEFGEPDFEPSTHEGLSAKSRWCVIGWLDPRIDYPPSPHQALNHPARLLPWTAEMAHASCGCCAPVPHSAPLNISCICTHAITRPYEPSECEEPRHGRAVARWTCPFRDGKLQHKQLGYHIHRCGCEQHGIARYPKHKRFFNKRNLSKCRAVAQSLWDLQQPCQRKTVPDLGVVIR